MGENNPTPEAAFRAVLQKRGDADHVTPEALVAYHHDRLPPAEADAVQEHLAACRSCADLVLELVSFADGTDAEGAAVEDEVGDPEAEADWQALRSRLVEPETPTSIREGAAREFPRRTTPYLAYALAASLLLAAGLGAWIAVLQGELSAARQPQALSIVSLYPDGFTRGDAAESTVRGGGDRFVVILTASPFPAAVEHRVEILDADGRSIWSGKGLRPTEQGTFPLELSRRLLEPGEYRIRLLAGDAPVNEFELHVAR